MEDLDPCVSRLASNMDAMIDPQAYSPLISVGSMLAMASRCIQYKDPVR